MSDRYDEYLLSDEWQLKRCQRLLMCETCEFPPSIRCEHRDCGLFVPLSALSVHHLTYDRVFRELMEDLAIYCHPCHAAAHGFPRYIWWDAAKKQGLTHVTKQFIWQYSRIKKIGEVMFKCLDKCPRAKFELNMRTIEMGLDADAAKYPDAKAQ